MITISLCMIVRDESKVLARCLNSVADLVDEIIIVDTGSADHTKAIAKQYTEHVYDFPWIDDFAAARNASFEKATMDYCMWLDADDVLDESERQKFRQMKEIMNNTADVVMLPYRSGEAFFCYRERLLRRMANFRWKGRVHEAITPSGNIIYGNAAITHHSEKEQLSDRNLQIYKAMIQAGEPFTPRDQYYYGRELHDHQYYEDAVQMFQQFLCNPDGWYINKVDACRLLANCYNRSNKDDLVLPILLQALQYDVPSSGICCDIGAFFLQQAQYRQAIWWYEKALTCKNHPQQGGFIAQDETGYIPAIQLCVCYDCIGQPQQAKQYNELAAQYHPDAEAVQYNRDYFKQKEI